MKIELVKDAGEIEQLYDFIRKHPLDYPNYLDWVEKCKRELELGYKKAFVCRKKGEIVGNLIFQKHKEDSSVLEMKNGRVDERLRQRKIFTRLYGEVEKYAVDNGFKRIVGDAHEDNAPIVLALKGVGFEIESKEQLYGVKQELILVKDLSEASGNGLVYAVEKFHKYLDIIKKFVLRVMLRDLR